MFGEMFDKSPLLLYPLCGLIIFILVFAGAALRAWRQPPAQTRALEQLPLQDEEVGHE